MTPDNWYFKEYKERNERAFDKSKELKPLPITTRPSFEHSDLPKPLPRPVQDRITNGIRPKITDYKPIRKPGSPYIIKLIIFLIILIPIIIVLYLLYVNFIANHEFNYLYDIGSANDNFLTPIQRISDKIQEPDINYRNLTGSLVYFNIDVPRGANHITIQTRFKDNFPNDSIMSLGAKDQEAWHYYYKTIFNPTLNDLSGFKNIDDVYLINPGLNLVTTEEIPYERNVIVATDNPYLPVTNIINDYNSSITIINTTLRGAHKFYIYASGDLNIEIKKQDLNWYKDADDLFITLYDSENYLIANITIPDDGIINTSKTPAVIQSGVLNATNLFEGVYILDFSSFDGLIKEIKINSNKIVTDNLFLADTSIYNQNNITSKVFLKINRDSEIRLLTYHPAGLQNVSYGINKTFNFNIEDKPMYLNLTTGEYYLSFPKNDIVISYPGYFSFSKENYFEPFRQRVVPIPRDIDWIKKNIDYLVTDYKPPVKDNDWLISTTEFDIDYDMLYVKDNKLSMVFNVPHLGNEQYLNNTIPIDWIKISVEKPGLFT